MSYTITIGGTDRKDCILFDRPLHISDELNDDINSMTLYFQNLDGGAVPANGDEVVYTIDGIKEFGGFITRARYSKPFGSGSLPIIALECVDYTRILDRELVNKTYENVTDQYLIRQIIDEYAADDGITYNNVGRTIVFTDMFESNIDDGLWNVWGGDQVYTWNSLLRLDTTTSVAYYGLASYRFWDMTDHSVTVDVNSIGDMGLTSYECYPVILDIDSNNQVYFIVFNGYIRAVKVVAGSPTTVGSDVPYSAANHRYFRIREEGGVLYYEYSADNDVYILHGSTSTPFNFTSIEYQAQVGTWDTEASTTSLLINSVVIEAVTPEITISQIRFKMETPSQALRRICELTGRNWYIDYDKDVHYFKNETNPAPFNITTTSEWFRNLEISHDDTQVKNKIYVKGSTYLSEEYTDNYVADGEQRIFVLPEKPHDLTIEVNSVSKTVGIKNIDDPASFDFLLNFQEKYVECGEGFTTPADGDVVTFYYKYEIPILISVEDSDSIAERGVYEFAIFDKNITDLQAARDRATAELTDYAGSIIDGSFETDETGFRSGQVININDSTYGVSNVDYVIVAVEKVSRANGNLITSCKFASKKRLGIIQFLIKQLQSNKDILTLSDDEVVDQLTELDDSLVVSDSIESMYLTSPPFAWSNDEGTTPNKLVWDFGEWS